MVYRYNTNRLDNEFRKVLKNLEEDTSPTLGGYLDLGGFGFVAQLTAGETLAAGNVCFLANSGNMLKADASTEVTSKGLLGLCTESLTLGDVGVFILKGFYDLDVLHIGMPMYLSTTAGDWRPYPPNQTGEIARVVGYAITPTQIFFDPDKTWVTIE